MYIHINVIYLLAVINKKQVGSYNSRDIKRVIDILVLDILNIGTSILKKKKKNIIIYFIEKYCL